MQYRRLGRSGLFVSAFSFGSWVTFKNQVDDSLGEKLMGQAYDTGINFFDNAEVYAGGESEVIMGRVLRKLGWSRDSYCVSSKVFWGGPKPTQRGLSRKHVFDACHAALKRLQVDYLDLFFCHRPDIHTPIEETVRAMNDLIQQGKVIYWGTSEWGATALMEAYGVARQYGLVPPTMEQPQYNLLVREKVEGDYLPLYDKFGLGTTVWSPLASGVLTGKYNDGIPEGSRMSLPNFEWLKNRLESEEGRRNIEKARALSAIADDLGISLTRMSLAWCLANPRVSTVILGASRPEQLEENLAALGDLSLLDDEVLARIDEVMANRPEPPADFSA
ncbi:potassium channel beta subunit family protein [Sulfidibacter corallicola]